ncbi:MAG: hypothetical protein HOM68_26665 [Gemmatimonadetes bacterium]|nr:hypothetical protein [Gemmatimonadota bacterium]MBT5060153.1 hypothetical protein [Gemmatimonadota bacterium]MBT5146076.1 hypothetical protein [Gemmatimonadota bacterium]MBT5591845.1 hypothetical protein [Gemmatimonadota bacterium]MBT5961520.1 hypothetical protein [Gemmatimonadota bacterium]
MTSFTDSDLTSNVTYLYRIVVEAAGLEWLGDPGDETGFERAGVVELTTEADDASGEIHLTWTRFAGTGFEGYEVRRQTPGADEVVILSSLVGQSDTVFVDQTVLTDVARVEGKLQAGRSRDLTHQVEDLRLLFRERLLQSLAGLADPAKVVAARHDAVALAEDRYRVTGGGALCLAMLILAIPLEAFIQPWQGLGTTMQEFVVHMHGARQATGWIIGGLTCT